VLVGYLRVLPDAWLPIEGSGKDTNLYKFNNIYLVISSLDKLVTFFYRLTKTYCKVFIYPFLLCKAKSRN